MLLTLDEKDPKRLFEGSALLKRLTTYGLLDDTKQKVRSLSTPPPASVSRSCDGGSTDPWSGVGGRTRGTMLTTRLCSCWLAA